MKRDSKGRFVSEGKVYATGYKGFESGLKCRSKQYKENTVFKEAVAQMCHKGMHFCEKAIDVLHYYGFLNRSCKLNEFAEVKALDKVVTAERKSVTTKLKIVGKLSIAEFISCITAYFSSRITTPKRRDVLEQTSQKRGITLCTSRANARLAGTGHDMELLAGSDGVRLVSAGDGCSLYATGFGRLAAVGFSTRMISTGNCSMLSTAGNGSKLITTGWNARMTAAAPLCALTATGENAQLASAGSENMLTALGENSVLAATGFDSCLYAEGRNSCLVSAGGCNQVYAAGENGIAITVGPYGRVKGKLGCFLGCAEWDRKPEKPLELISFASGWVDGEKIKPDTWYTAKEGKLVEG